MSVGLRIFLQVARPDPALVDELAGVSTTDLADAMQGLYVLHPDLRPVHGQATAFAGPAVTVYCTPGDGLLVRKAVETLKPGDVLVINAGGCGQRAVLGGNVAADLARCGVRGVVVDGAVRDVEELAALKLPVYARAVTPRSGSTRAGSGEVNVPVAVGGVAVFPGDVVVGDGDGLVVVPAPDAGAVLRRVRARGRAGLQDREASAERGAGRPIHGLDMANEALAVRGGKVSEGPYRREGAG